MLPSDAERQDTSSVLETVHGRSAWALFDGRLGTASKVTGLAQALGLASEVHAVAPRRLWALLAPWGPADPLDRIGGSSGRFSPPWPDLVLAAGRRTIAYLRAMRRASEGATFTVLLQNPRTPFDVADLVWCPLHDGVTGANVITTLTTPHRMRPADLARLRAETVREVEALPSPRVAVCLGGPNGAYRYDSHSLDRLAGCLGALARQGASFMITPSQRTSGALFAAAVAGSRSSRRLVWTRSGPNPYWSFLAHADAVIVTADSVNMTSEACVTGRPVLVFEPNGGSGKFERFHSALRHYGATRPLTQSSDITETWSYAPLDAAPEIALEIARRFLAIRDPNLAAQWRRRALEADGHGTRPAVA
ncbi:MAG: mitochondrial fission ELM1 family protein [Pseudomonadota bacterium]